MQPPKCRLCGAIEWQHVCSGGAGATMEVTKSVTSPLRKRVTPAAAVTPSRNTPAAVTDAVTPCRQCKLLKAELKAVRAEAEALQGEVRQLKRALADSHGGKSAVVPPVSAAERMRRMRAKRKESKHV